MLVRIDIHVRTEIREYYEHTNRTPSSTQYIILVPKHQSSQMRHHASHVYTSTCSKDGAPC